MEELEEIPDLKNREELVKMYRDNPAAAARDLLGIDLAPHQRVILKSMWDCNNVILVLSRGGGKCVTFDTICETEEGFFQIGELCEGEDKDFGFSECGINFFGENGFKVASHTYKNKPKSIYRLNTKYGYSISAVNKHMIRCLEKDEIIWKRMDEIKIGDKVVIVKNSDYDFNGRFKNESLDEGYLTGRIIDKKSRGYKIPKKMLQSNKKVLGAYISGCADAIAKIVKDGIRFTSESNELLRQLQIILLTYGIVSIRKDGKRKYLLIEKEYVDVFTREIGFRQVENNCRLKSFFLDDSKLCEDKFFIDKVKDIELYQEEVTYDVHIPDDHTFLSNGFISHNTFIDAVFAVLRALLFPGEKVGIFGPSYRQCLNLNGDTPLFTDKGMFMPHDFYKNIVCNKTHVQSVVKKNLIKHKWLNQEADGLRIRTSGMFDFDAKLGHRVLTATDDGLIYKSIDDIQEGDTLPVRIGFNLFGKTTQLPKEKYIVTKHDKYIEIPKNITEDFAYFIGLIIGDGCLSKKKNNKSYRICFTTGDESQVELYVKLCKKLFNRTPSIRKSSTSNCWALGITSKRLYYFLEQCGLSNCGAFKKTIPEIIKRAPKKFVCSFLRGLFDTGGYACKNMNLIGLSTSSPELAHQVRAILLNLGIFAKICISNKESGYNINGITGRKSISYSVRITSVKYIERFRSIVSFGLERKQEIINSYRYDNNCKWSDKIPIPRNIISAIKKKLKSAYGAKSASGHIRSAFGQMQGDFITPERLGRGIKYLADFSSEIEEYKILKDMYSIEYGFVHVTGKEKIKCETFDIEVENESCYWAGGIIHHNSKFVFAEVEKIYDMSPLLRDSCEKKPTKMTDMCYLQFKSTGNKPGSVIHCLPLGEGCCSISDTYIDSVDKNIVNLRDEFPECLDENVNCQEFAKKTMVWSNGEFRESDYKFYNGIKDTKIITTKKGFEIEATLNHKFKIIKNGKIIWKSVDDLSVGDRILIDKSKRFGDSDTDLTKEECYAFGLLVGNGCFTYQCGFGFATRDVEFINSLRKGTPFRWNQCSDIIHWTGSGGQDKKKKYLERFQYPDKCITINKFIPKPILRSSKNKLASFISGIFDTDGCIQVSKIKGKEGGCIIGFTNTSKRLIHELQYVLTHFGIVANVSSRKRIFDKRVGAVEWNICYDLLITGKDVLTFYQEIGFRLNRKQSILENFVKNKKRWNSVKDEEVPVNKKDLIEFRLNNKPDVGYKNNCSYIVAHNIERKKYITKYFIEKFLKMYNDTNSSYLDELREISNENIYYDTIESLKESKCPTADIQVPDGHEYCANGFFSHNSTIRGARYFTIIIDEAAQVPREILDVVVRGMMATSKNPMEQVKAMEEQKRLLAEGKIKKIKKLHNNKIILSSTAYYQFNHFWDRVKGYIEIITEKAEKIKRLVQRGEEIPEDLNIELRGHDLNGQIPYNIMKDENRALIAFNWKDFPEGFMNEESIEEARREMPHYQHLMEYFAFFPSDSDGFFPRSLLDKARNHGKFTTAESLDKNKRYVNIMGIDPARSGDNFAIAIFQVDLEDKKIRLVRMFAYNKQPYPVMHLEIRKLMKQYNIDEIAMDSGGGGTTIRDMLADTKTCPVGDSIILQRGFDEHALKQGKRILDIKEFSRYEWLHNANHNLLLGLQNGMLQIATDKGSLSKTDDYNETPFEEEARRQIDNTINEIQNIIATPTSNGRMRWDTPHKKQRKDRYSAVLIGYDQAYSYLEGLNKPQSLASGFWD